MIPEIKEYQDWYVVEPMLKRMMKDRLEFFHDYSRLCKNIEIKLKELGIIDIELKKQKSSVHYSNLKKQKLKEINDTVRMFSKILLITSLSKR
jgi:hypothetical protein